MHDVHIGSLLGQSVFISYASTDRQIALEIAQALDSLGIKYFLDQKDIDWGSSVSNTIHRGITDSSALLVVISPASMKSQWVSFEIGQAIGAGKLILPFLTNPENELPSFLSDLHFVTSVEEMENYFLEFTNSGRATTSEHDRLGPFSGRYTGLTWGRNHNIVLVEDILCTQIGERVTGSIAGVCVLTKDPESGVWTETADNKASYRLSGFVDQRLFVVSYQSTEPMQHSAGALALKANGSGIVFVGKWTGLVEDVVETSQCIWIKLDVPNSTGHARNEMVSRAKAYANYLPTWINSQYNIGKSRLGNEIATELKTAINYPNESLLKTVLHSDKGKQNLRRDSHGED